MLSQQENNTNIGSYEYKGYIWKAPLKDIIDYCKVKKRIYIYGEGYYGKFLYEQLKSNDIHIDGFAVSDTSFKGEDEDALILNDIDFDADTGVIICSGNGFEEAMAANLLRKGIKDYKVLNVMLRIPKVEYLKGRFTPNDCFNELKDGILRLRITNRCPGKCEFCGQQLWSERDQQMEMDPVWYYEYLEPLYPKLKMMLITGGDPFYAKESYNFMKMISLRYPKITIMTESNGLTFNKKFQELACDNLFVTHFSLNASNHDTYSKGCWTSGGGEKAYESCINNVASYMELLKSKHMECFAPDVSMVINHNTFEDVAPFAEMALEMGFGSLTYYFDYRENDMGEDYFQHPEYARGALDCLLEIEKILKDRVRMDFRLWIPLKELTAAEKRIETVSLHELERKYKKIFMYASKRSIIGEYEQRNVFRRKKEKKEFTMEEDSNNIQSFAIKINGRMVCASPWKMIDLYPNGRMDFCGWTAPVSFLFDNIKDKRLDVDRLINSEEFRKYRANMLNGNYKGCMTCCPIIRKCHNITD